MEASAGHRLSFAAYRIDLKARVLSDADGEIALRPRSFDVLACLVHNAGALMSKDEIIAVVWPDVIASDESLARCISDIRTALDDADRRIIRTVPGRGYLFAAEVKTAESAADQPKGDPSGRHHQSRARVQSLTVAVALMAAAVMVALIWFARSVDDPSRTEGRPSIAVLPFDNLSNDSEQAYFADGMADDLITGLSKLSALSVAARRKSFRYRDRTGDATTIGRDLGVRYLLQGSVRRSGDQVRINAQLVDSSTGRNLWAERYDGRLSDVFALQDKVTGRIIEALSISLGEHEKALIADRGTTNIDAHDAFLRGQSHARDFTVVGAERAVRSYTLALKLDPDYDRARKALEQIRFIQKNSGLK